MRETSWDEIMWRDERQIQEGAHTVYRWWQCAEMFRQRGCFSRGRGLSRCECDERWGAGRMARTEPARHAPRKALNRLISPACFTQYPPTFNLSDQVAV